MKYALMLLIAILTACASQPKSEEARKADYEAWYRMTRSKVEPIWKPLMARELIAEGRKNDVRKDLNDYTVRVAATIDSNGRVLNHQIIKPSAVPAMNRIAETTLAKLDPVPPPPAGLVQGGKAKFVWDLKVEQ